MAKYLIGGIPVELDDTNAGIPVIHPNRTLFVQKLTSRPNLGNLEIKEGLQTEDEVYEHYQPSVKVEFQTASGKLKKEELTFKNRGHWGKNGLVDRSDFLKNLNRDEEDLADFIKRIKSDTGLQEVLSNAETRTAFTNGLKAMIQMINDSE